MNEKLQKLREKRGTNYTVVENSYSPSNGARIGIMSIAEPEMTEMPEHTVFETHLLCVRERERALYYITELRALSNVKFDEDGDPDGMRPHELLGNADDEPLGRFLVRVPLDLASGRVIRNADKTTHISMPANVITQGWRRRGEAPLPSMVAASMCVMPAPEWEALAERALLELAAGESSTLEKLVETLMESGVASGEDKDELRYKVHVSFAREVQTSYLPECMTVLCTSSTHRGERGYVPLIEPLQVAAEAISGHPMLPPHSLFGQWLASEVAVENVLDAEKAFSMGNNLSVRDDTDTEGAVNIGSSMNVAEESLTTRFRLIDMENEEEVAALLADTERFRRTRAITDTIPALIMQGVSLNFLEQTRNMAQKGGFPEPFQGRVITMANFFTVDPRMVLLHLRSRSIEDAVDAIVGEWRAIREVHAGALDAETEENSDLSRYSSDNGGEVVRSGNDADLEEQLREQARESIEALLYGDDDNDDAFRDLLSGLSF